jgi:hypothetical protein
MAGVGGVDGLSAERNNCAKRKAKATTKGGEANVTPWSDRAERQSTDWCNLERQQTRRVPRKSGPR